MLCTAFLGVMDNTFEKHCKIYLRGNIKLYSSYTGIRQSCIENASMCILALTAVYGSLG